VILSTFHVALVLAIAVGWMIALIGLFAHPWLHWMNRPWYWLVVAGTSALMAVWSAYRGWAVTMIFMLFSCFGGLALFHDEMREKAKRGS
jgi:amino acid transporter